MPTVLLPPRAAVLAALLAGAMVARAQTPAQRDELVGAARQGNSSGVVTQLQAWPFGAAIDALLAADLPAAQRNTALGVIAEARRDDVARLWVDEPPRRAERAALFRRVPSVLAGRLAKGGIDAAEHDLVLELARGMALDRGQLDVLVNAPPTPQHREAAADMLRALVRSEVARGDLANDPTGFVLAATTTATAPQARAAAAVGLRRRLGLPVPAWLGDVVDLPDDPDAVRNPDRTRDARWTRHWIRIGLQTPIDPLPRGPIGSRFPVPCATANDMKAADCFRVAAADVEGSLAVLGIACNSPDPRVARRAIAALCRSGDPRAATAPRLDHRAASMVTALLDHQDAEVRAAAAWLAYALCLRPPVSRDLQNAVVERAVAALATSPDALGLSFGQSCTGRFANGPEGAASALVLAAAQTADARVRQPLLAAALGTEAGAANRMGDPFWQEAVAAIAPDLDADAMRRVLGAIGPMLALVHSESPAGSPLARLAARLFLAAPEELLPAFAGIVELRCVLDAFEQQIPEAVAAASPTRMRRVVEPLRLHSRPLLHVLAPEVLFESLAEGGGADRMCEALALMKRVQYANGLRLPAVRQRLLAALASYELQREALPWVWIYLSPVLQLGPAELLALAPSRLWAEPAWQQSAGYYVGHWPVADSPAVQPALRTLAQSPNPAIVRAAATRLATLGPAARQDLSFALDRLAECGGDGAVAALQIAIEHGIDTDALRRAASTRCESPFWASAYALRFLGVEPAAVSGCDPVALCVAARVDVGVVRLRAAMVDPTCGSLRGALEQGMPETRRRALGLLCELDHWPWEVERLVLLATTDADVPVRFAAYTALKSRDPELRLSAWVVHDAVFDPDASVRALAR